MIDRQVLAKVVANAIIALDGRITYDEDGIRALVDVVSRHLTPTTGSVKLVNIRRDVDGTVSMQVVVTSATITVDVDG